MRTTDLRVVQSSDLAVHTHRDPVWPTLLMLLIGFMSVELVLSGMISRERFGVEAIPETVEQTGTSPLVTPQAIRSASEWKAEFSKPHSSPVNVER